MQSQHGTWHDLAARLISDGEREGSLTRSRAWAVAVLVEGFINGITNE